VFGEMAENTKQAASQRMRWEAGRSAVLRNYFGKLIRPSAGGSLLARIDALADMATPPLSQYAASTLVGSLILLPMGWIYSLPLLIAVTASCAALALALFQTGANWKTVGSLLLTPAFLIWKISLRLGHSTKASTDTWIRTLRPSEVQ
jgi:hypothetical protein